MKSIQEYLQLLSLPEKFDSLSSIKLQTSNINSEVVLGLDQSNIYHCLFPIKQTLKAKRISRGFSLRSRLLLNESTSKEELFLDLIWSQSNDLKLFCSVVDEIVRQEFNSESIELEIIQVISRWEYLLSPAKTEFTENKCKGLFGELTILSALMRNLSTDFTPVMWTGPLGAPHDFELSDRSIEVKTSQYGVNRIQINGLYQLEKVDEKNLELFHVWVEKDQNGKSIHDLRSQIESEFPSAYTEVLAKLELLSYEIEDENIDRYRFRFMKLRKYCVDDQFPTLTRANFASQADIDAILNVKYDIDLIHRDPKLDLDILDNCDI